MHSRTVIKLIQESNYLPKIPKAFGEVLNMLLEPCTYDMDECIEKLATIPELEAILVKALNCSTKLQREILTLKDAVLYLGAKNTRMIIIAHITRLLLPNKSGRAKIFNNKIYWKHCIATSIASYLIAEETKLCDQEKIFTYGLIHDIGTTVLDICLPDHLDKIFVMQKQQGVHQIVAEKIVLNGITHTDIGMWLCREWGLPEEIVEVVGYHHSPFANSKTGDEVKIVHLADCISTNYFQKLMGNHKNLVYAEKIRELLNISKELIEKIAREILDEVNRITRVFNFEPEIVPI